MKTLTLLRHAKSGWDDAITRDFDRPLNAKGRRAAQVIGRHLRDEGCAWDAVVASPAVRVVETIAAVEEGLGRALSPEHDRRLYLASTETLLDVVHALPDSAATALLIGHNPGLEDLTLLLAAEGDLRGRAEEKYPTATVAMLEVDGGWNAVAAGAMRLTRFVRPRDLDASLGPDLD